MHDHLAGEVGGKRRNVYVRGTAVGGGFFDIVLVAQLAVVQIRVRVRVSALALGLLLAFCCQKPQWSTLSKRLKMYYQALPKAPSPSRLSARGELYRGAFTQRCSSAEDDTPPPRFRPLCFEVACSWRKARPGCRNTGPDKLLEKGPQRWRVSPRKEVFSQSTRVVRRSY